MAELSEACPQVLAEEPDEPQSHTTHSTAETNAREDTELARLRRRYTDRTRSSRPAVEKKPASLVEHGIYAIKKFWRHQVSITVDHNTCRDHLGMFSLQSQQSHAFLSDRVSTLQPLSQLETRETMSEQHNMQKVIWHLTDSVSRRGSLNRYCQVCRHAGFSSISIYRGGITPGVTFLTRHQIRLRGSN